MATRLNFSMTTNSVDLQKYIEANIVHRQGFTYGASLGKKLCLFIDDFQASATNGLEKFKNAPEVKIKNNKKEKLKYKYVFD
jgi:dynein heavy chain